MSRRYVPLLTDLFGKVLQSVDGRDALEPEEEILVSELVVVLHGEADDLVDHLGEAGLAVELVEGRLVLRGGAGEHVVGHVRGDAQGDRLGGLVPGRPPVKENPKAICKLSQTPRLFPTFASV